MANDLSWLLPFEAAGANTYGSNSADVLTRLLSENSGSAADLLKTGAITEAGGVDWSKLPHYGPAGDLPANSMLFPTAQRIDPYTMKPVQDNAPQYNDPNYGALSLIRQRAPDDLTMKIGRALVLSLVGGGIAGAAAPAIGSSLGLGSGANPWISRILQLLPRVAQKA